MLMRAEWSSKKEMVEPSARLSSNGKCRGLNLSRQTDIMVALDPSQRVKEAPIL